MRSHKPMTLQEAISCARDLQDAIPKAWAPVPLQAPFPQSGHDTRPPPQRYIQGHGQLDDETWRDLCRRKLCFTCQEPWASGHRCTKGKAHYIELFSDSELEDDAKKEMGTSDNEP